MFFRQVLHEDLGCASYVVADAGEAAVIDPKWEIEDYLVLADEHGFEFRHILETHNHADHVSGKGRLAKATGAAIYVPAKADVAFDHVPLDQRQMCGIKVRARGPYASHLSRNSCRDRADTLAARRGLTTRCARHQSETDRKHQLRSI